MRELPEAISRLEARLAELTADSETARAHEQDPVTIDGVTCPREKVVSVLGGCLDALPAEVKETRRFVLGQMRGLTFGIIKHRFSPPEVFLEGQGRAAGPALSRVAGPAGVFERPGAAVREL